ncbi:MCE family protein [Corallococcus sp. H22C18031201]|uniref:MlaD family protein n=1 Tax=Citreicoccus inhibens TaxID=2849499 RepID=UPI000E719167|nr:MlaD family protein [Citreicoccus inhibens]MBU8895618.1 MCE family protein [Citreicoccus inhibens]RJS20054.1 MCE family protein [Corallococcus sp. H22C18031201]
MSLFTSVSTKERRLALRAGLFVAIGLAVAGVVVFFIGQESHLFQSKVRYRAFFSHVDGLSDKSPVWLGGMEVGHVTGVNFAADIRDARLEVELDVSSRYAERVRGDSVVRLTSMGVLGDKAVDISMGTADAPQVPPGGVLQTAEGGDLSSLMRSASRVMENSVAISESLKEAVAIYSNPDLGRDLARSVASLRAVLEEVEKGDGALHALIFDKASGREVRALLSRTASAAERLDGAVGHVEAILAEVHRGDGTAHQLIYGNEGTTALHELGEAAGQLAGLLEDAKKSPNGAVHQLIYGDARDLFANLGGAAADLRKVTATVAKGEGTVGGLISDPTIYEDIREVLGNVKRNRILRALVRFSLDNRESLEQVGKPREQPVPTPPTNSLGARPTSPATEGEAQVPAEVTPNP